MKKELIITGVLGITGILFLAFVLANSARLKNMPPKKSPATTQSSPSGIEMAPQPFTASDVSRHATSTDCYMIVNNRVYDLTTYLSKHKTDISIYCGKDGTEAFNTRQGRGPHDSEANELLQSMQIGIIQEN